MPNSLFVDTSGWASFFIQDQPHYPQALEQLSLARTQNHQIITTNYIITELVALLDSPLRQPRNRVFEIINTIKSRPYIQTLHISESIDHSAWELCQLYAEASPTIAITFDILATSPFTRKR